MKSLLDLQFAAFWKWYACYKVRDGEMSFFGFGFRATRSLVAGLVLLVGTQIHGIGSALVI